MYSNRFLTPLIDSLRGEPDAAKSLLSHDFGSLPPLSLEVEEELLLVDADSRLWPCSVAVLESLPGRARDYVTPQLFAAQIGVRTGPCEHAGEVVARLSEARRQIVAGGFGLLGAGLHPRGGFADASIASKPDDLPLLEELRSLLRTPPCALNVQVAMPDPESAVRAANGLRRHIPVLQALTANSPFWHGVDSGSASSRAVILRNCPGVEMPPAFAGYEQFCATAAGTAEAMGAKDPALVRWDVRPRPHLGTVEVRALDAQPSVARNAAIAALIQALAAREVEEPAAPALPREALEECHHQAARHGLSARLCRVDGSTAPAAEVLGDTLLEALPYARGLGSEPALDALEAAARQGNGADEQRRLHCSLGMQGLLGHLGRRTEALV